MTIFKGFKQVTLDYFNGVAEEDKLGYIWFVRSDISGDTYTGDIYLGTRHYAHTGAEVEEAVEYIENILKEAGIIDESGQTVDIMSLIEASQLTPGVAVSIEDKIISVNVAEPTENKVDDVDTNKNFLKVNNDNELEVKGVDADATVTAEEITIEGGPLAELAKQAYTDGKLPAGTSIQDFLKAMLCVEIWDNPSVAYTFTASAAKPTATLSQSGSKPVGTAVNASATKGNSSASQKAVASGFGTSGYFNGDTAVLQDSYTQSKTPSASGEYTLNASFSGFKEKDGDVFVNAIANDGTQKTVYVANGTNRYTVNETGLTYEPAAFDEVVLNDRSNLGGKSTTDTVISEANFEASGAYAPSKPTSSTNSASITGYYPIFYGSIANTKSTDEDITESVLTNFGYDKSDVPSGTGAVSTPSGTGTFIIAVPEGNANYSKTGITLLDSKGMSFGASHAFATTVEMLNGIEVKNYKVFYITNANPTTAAATWTLTFNN